MNMSKENIQWLVLALVVVGFIGLGALTIDQGSQLTKVSNALIALNSKIENLAQIPTATQPAVNTQRNTSNVFDPFKNNSGDMIAGLKLVSFGPVPGINRPLAMDNVDAKFSGSVTLSGSYDYSLNDFAGKDMACFTPTENDKIKIPVLAGVSDQNTRFCFNNIQKAKQAFGPAYGNGQATITINNYELIYAPAEVVNQAELVNVLSKTRH